MGKLRKLEAQASHRKTSLRSNFHTIFYYLLGMFFVKNVFYVLLCVEKEKIKTRNFVNFVQLCENSEPKITFFIFRALHVQPSFLPLSLECLPSIYVCFMFLEFWLNLFIKIAVDENVFLSLNSREIAVNEGFSKKIGVNGGKLPNEYW